MLLDAYYAQMKSLHTHKAVTVKCVTNYNYGGPAYPYNFNMYKYPLEMMRFAALNTFRTTKGGGNGVVFGDGTTPVKKSDYWLSGNQITNLTVTATRTYTPDDNGCTFTGTYTLTNSTAEDITISEVGYQHALSRESGAYSDYYLIDRTLLDNPLTIPASGIGLLTYNIRVDFPTE